MWYDLVRLILCLYLHRLSEKKSLYLYMPSGPSQSQLWRKQAKIQRQQPHLPQCPNVYFESLSTVEGNVEGIEDEYGLIL